MAGAPRHGLAPVPPETVQAELAALNIQQPYLLCVGTAEPGKRAVDALRAVSLMKERGGHVQLVLAGNAGRLSEPLRREASHLGIEDRVVFAGYVPADTLAALYSGAIALIFASLYEGFGLPPLEAMTCGAPVIASAAPAMREVLGEAALFVPLRDPRAIAAHASAPLDDSGLRREWVERGRARAALYSWDRAADETVAVYRELAR